MIWIASAAIWINLAATGISIQDTPFAVTRAALESGDYIEAESLLLQLPHAQRGTLEARLWFEVGDFVRCTQAAREQILFATDGAERRELAWWGAKAALWLGDARGARAWIDRLAVESIGDDDWGGVVTDYTALALELESSAADARQRLRASQALVLASVMLLGFWGFRLLRQT